MTSPHVIELPRRLEAVSRDTFLADAEARSASVAELRRPVVTERAAMQRQARAA